MMDEETAYKHTVDDMRKKMLEECNKRGCAGCPLEFVSDDGCYTGSDEAVRSHYAIMFSDKTNAEAAVVDQLKEGVKVQEIKQYLSVDNAVDHPAHYCYSKYEPKDVIRGWGLNFNLGSAVKYIARAGRKDDIIQDLEKAKKFLEFEIEALKEEREDGH